jgi:hypothetical protein
MSPLSEASAPTTTELRKRYELLLEQGTTDYEDLEANVKKLKELILAHGIPVRLQITSFHPANLSIWRFYTATRSAALLTRDYVLKI